MCTCALCSLTCTLHVHYENFQFEWVKGHVSSASSNYGLLLTSSIILPSFIILRLNILLSYGENSHTQTDRRTNGHTRRSDIKHSCGILDNDCKYFESYGDGEVNGSKHKFHTNDEIWKRNPQSLTWIERTSNESIVCIVGQNLDRLFLNILISQTLDVTAPKLENRIKLAHASYVIRLILWVA